MSHENYALQLQVRILWSNNNVHFELCGRHEKMKLHGETRNWVYLSVLATQMNCQI